MTFTTNELKLAEKLAHDNHNNQDITDIGFEFKGQWITNPFMDETCRFAFEDFNAMCDHYGKENIVVLLKKLLEADAKQENNTTI